MGPGPDDRRLKEHDMAGMIPTAGGKMPPPPADAQSPWMAERRPTSSATLPKNGYVATDMPQHSAATGMSGCVL